MSSSSLIFNEYVLCIESAQQLLDELVRPRWLALTDHCRLLVFDRGEERSRSGNNGHNINKDALLQSRSSSAASDDCDASPQNPTKQFSSVPIEEFPAADDVQQGRFSRRRSGSSASYQQYMCAEGEVKNDWTTRSDLANEVDVPVEDKLDRRVHAQPNSAKHELVDTDVFYALI